MSVDREKGTGLKCCSAPSFFFFRFYTPAQWGCEILLDVKESMFSSLVAQCLTAEDPCKV